MPLIDYVPGISHGFESCYGLDVGNASEVHVLKTGPPHDSIERCCEPFKGGPFSEVLGLL